MLAGVHFALVCGARSCPPIRAYSIKNLDRGLDLATRAFCAENVSAAHRSCILVPAIIHAALP